MNRTTIGALILLVIGGACIAAPLVFPPADVYKHDTSTAFAQPNNQSTIQQILQEEYTSVHSYSNLSDRGQKIYREALDTAAGDDYWTKRPAPDWSYDKMAVIIERTEGVDLPPADEEDSGLTYDMMSVTKGSAPLVSIMWVGRLILLGVGVVCLTAGGYILVERR